MQLEIITIYAVCDEVLQAMGVGDDVQTMLQSFT